MENEPKYPYRDPDFGFWIYDRLPEYMEPAEPRELWPGRHVMYRSKAARGEIFIQRSK